MASAPAQLKGRGTVSEGDPSFTSIGVKNTTVKAQDGVTLSAHQKLLVGSVLDVSVFRPPPP